MAINFPYGKTRVAIIFVAKPAKKRYKREWWGGHNGGAPTTKLKIRQNEPLELGTWNLSTK